MTLKWNAIALSTQNKVYFKTEIQLARHYKVWRMKQSMKEARQKVNLTRLYDALRRVLPLPERGIAPIDDTLQRQSLGSSSCHHRSNITIRENGLEVSGVDDANSREGNRTNTEVIMTQISTSVNRSGNKRKRCSHCVVEKCTGGYNRRNCRVWKLANPGTYESATRKCRVCNQAGCPGHSDRRRCQSFGNIDVR